MRADPAYDHEKHHAILNEAATVSRTERLADDRRGDRGNASVVCQDFEVAPQVDDAPAFTNGPPPNGTPFAPYRFA